MYRAQYLSVDTKLLISGICKSVRRIVDDRIFCVCACARARVCVCVCVCVGDDISLCIQNC